MPENGFFDRVGDWFSRWTDGPRNQMQISWNDGSRRMEVRASGTVTFTDDDSDVKSVSPGGYITITETDGARHTYEARAKSDGSLERLFDGKPAGSDARAFLARILPALIRETAFGAETRVTRFLARGGPAAVLDEISRIKSGYAKRLYFKHLLAQATLDATTTTRAIRQAGTEITSDYERASALADFAKAGLPDDASRLAFAEATRTMKSDYEKHRAFKALLANESLDDGQVTRVIDAATTMNNDYELAGLLVSLVREQRMSPAAFTAAFKAVETLESDYERGRVLGEICRLNGVSADTLGMVVRATATMKSDYERANVLVAVAGHGPLDAGLRKACEDAARRLRSEYEQNRALAALARTGASSTQKTTAAVFQALGSGR